MSITLNQTNVIKGIAILLVIFGHLDIIKNSGAWGVGLFLITSGYGLKVSYDKNKLNKFFTKKICKVIFPYSIVTSILIFIDIVIGKKYSIFTIITSILGINTKAMIDPSMWYIPYIIIWYILFYLVFRTVNLRYLRVVLLFICSYLLNTYLPNIFIRSAGVYLYGYFFPFGVFLATFKFEFISNKIKDRLYIIVFLTSCIMMYFAYGNTGTKNLYLFNISVACLGIISLVLIFKNHEFNILQYIGKISFYLYLIEAVFLWKYDFIFKYINSKLLAILVYFVVILTIAIFMDKYNRKFNCLLTERTT